MAKQYLTLLFVGFMLTTLSVQASYNKRGYELIKNEEAAEKRSIRQHVSYDSENKENNTTPVPSALHPGFEQYLLHCENEGIRCDLNQLKKDLRPALGDYRLFFEWLSTRYAAPPSLIPSLYEALKIEVQAQPKKSTVTGVLKRVSESPPEKRQLLRAKIDLAYSQEIERLNTQLLSAMRSSDIQGRMKLTYKMAKLDYYYALTLNPHSEEQSILLRKAQDRFNSLQQFKRDKSKQYFSQIVHQLLSAPAAVLQ